ncbi:hypothetical protein AB1Y20_014658 [Prymnesium parvum]|uniref:Uncharacterized protein n=1 Tax=Prymnesium parvum TaxID=97485 RepID=A0AB34IET3_PRYPA
MTPMRYRIDPIKFPQLCVKCHQPAGETCLCAQAKANRAFAQQRRAERSIAAQHAKQANAGPSTMNSDIARWQWLARHAAHEDAIALPPELHAVVAACSQPA